MIIQKKLYNGIEVCLQTNGYYAKNKEYEAKYHVLYYMEGFSCWRVLYVCNRKTDFTMKQIKQALENIGIR